MAASHLSILLHYFKNALGTKKQMRESLGFHSQKLISLCQHPLKPKLSVVIPGYLFEYIPPEPLSKLKEFSRKKQIEWITPGYTEPFLGLSPPWLNAANIGRGAGLIASTMGAAPSSYAPPFGNWDAHIAPIIDNLGFSTVVLPVELLSKTWQNVPTSWILESGNTSLNLIPARRVKPGSSKEDICTWYAKTVGKTSGESFLAMQYMLDLTEHNSSYYQWLLQSFDSLQTQSDIVLHRCVDIVDDFNAQPLQSVASSLRYRDIEESEYHYYKNWFYSIDQAGLLQRRMLDLASRIEPIRKQRLAAPLIKALMHVQDINRYLPFDQKCGISSLPERLWIYKRIIEIENEAAALTREPASDGSIRITDYLKTGSKLIFLANRDCKLAINYRQGAVVVACEYRPRLLNICAGYAVQRLDFPSITQSGKSAAMFNELLLLPSTTLADFQNQSTTPIGTLGKSEFEYRLKKTNKDMRIILSTQVPIMQNGKKCPLYFEKIFRLDPKRSVVRVDYTLQNPSLTSYRFQFAIQHVLILPGTVKQKALLKHRSDFHTLSTGFQAFENIDICSLIEPTLGIQYTFQHNKAATICIRPQQPKPQAYQGSVVTQSVPILLPPTARWHFRTTFSLRKMSKKEAPSDEI